MKKNIYVLISAIIICLLFFACVKQNFYISDENKAYCLFGIDSYWIFQDSVTLEIDSIVLREVLSAPMTESGLLSSGESEHYSIEADVFRDGIKIKSIDISIQARPTINMSLELYYNGWYWYHGGNIGTIYKNTVHSGIQYCDYYDTLAIDNSIYNEVKCFINYGDILPKSYWAKNIGPVKFENFDNNYHLIRYNINPYSK